MTKALKLLEACYALRAPTFEPQNRTAAQEAGIRYERAIIKRLKSLHERVDAGPWLYYRTATISNVCQPDALIWLTPSHCLIVEVKLTWKPNARLKLQQFYGPILRHIHPGATFSFLQIYKNGHKRAHKKPISLYDLESFPKTKYKEAHVLL
jgi:hypothetical protein